MKSPSSEMITVQPAKSTARPDVARAAVTAARGWRPSHQPLPEPGHDEQGVVDPHAQPDHGQHLGGEDGHVQDVAQQVLEGEPDGDPEQRRHDGKTHGHHRPEGDQHDDHGRRDPDALARARFGRDHVSDHRTTELDVVSRTGVALRRVDQLGDGAVGDARLVPVELHDGEGDMPIGRDLVDGPRGERARHAGHVREGPQPFDHRRRPGHHGGRPQRRAGLDDDIGGRSRRLRKARHQDVLDPLRLGVTRREVVLVAGAHRLGDRRQGDDRDNPQEQHPPAVVVAPAGHSTEEAVLSRRRMTVASDGGRGRGSGTHQPL